MGVFDDLDHDSLEESAAVRARPPTWKGLFGHYSVLPPEGGPPSAGRSEESGSRSSRPPVAAPPPADSNGQRAAALRFDDAAIAELISTTFLSTSVERPPRMTVFYAVDHRPDAALCGSVASSLADHTAQPVCLVQTGADRALPCPHGYIPLSPLPQAVASINRVLTEPLRTLAPALWGLSMPHVPERAWLTSRRASWMVDHLRHCFTWIVVDAGSFSADGLLLGRLSDGAVLVVAAHRTRRQAALEAKARLDRAGIRVLGSVLTNRTFPIPESVYRRL